MIAISKSSLDATAQIWIEIVECFGRSVDSVRSAMLRVTTLKCNRCCTPPILLSLSILFAEVSYQRLLCLVLKPMAVYVQASFISKSPLKEYF